MAIGFSIVPSLAKFSFALVNNSPSRSWITAADEESLKPVDPIDWYHADEAVALYESFPAADAHGWWLDILPKGASLVLEVGAGSDEAYNQFAICDLRPELTRVNHAF